MGTTKVMLETYLKENGVFVEEIHPLVAKAINTISGEVPYRLKLSIALSELITLTSHLRKNIMLHDGTIVPCNALTFALAKSGVSKDSSMNMVRKALKSGYEIINQYRKDLAKHKAEKVAILEGKTKEEWMNYYEKPRDLQAGLGTVEGIIHHFAELEQGEVGAGFISSSEIGTDLQTIGNMPDIIKTLAIGYDLGKIPSKIIKSTDGQTAGIETLPINALFFGSEDAVLYNNAIKALFKQIFGVQLARRSLFSFTPEVVPPIEFKSIAALQSYKDKERETTLAAQEAMLTDVVTIVENTNQEPLTLSTEAQTLFDVYKEHNNLVANDMKAQYPITKLSRRHKQWLALKLSGNYAILDGNETITKENYVCAINTIEIFSDDLMNFEKELVKEAYEIFAEFCHFNAEDGKYSIGLHALRKLGYIPMTGSPKTKIDELVNLVSSYDKDAIYTVCQENSICYEEIIRTNVAGLSYVEVSGTKDNRAKQCADGFEFYETDFEELGNMLTGDFAYSPFRFEGGVRGKDNLLGGCKFIALDIDKSSITDEECHLLLEGVNHHIARTSDKNNQFKFRVLIELDSIVNIEDNHWRFFMDEIGNELGLTVDLLPKSQIYFAYMGRGVLSELEGAPLVTRELILKAIEKANAKPTVKKLSTAQQKALLENKMSTFEFAYNAVNGEGSRSLVRAGLYAIDLGASQEAVEMLIHDINNFWVSSMDTDRLEYTVLNYLRRKF